jgi:hypothetical protein
MSLKSFKEKLESGTNLLVSERGSGKTAFLFIRSPERAVEVSEAVDAFYVEYWDNADEGSDIDSVKHEYIKSESDAYASVKAWLVPTGIE